MSDGPGRRSRLRLVDTLRESWLEVTRRPGRAVMTGLGVALGAAAIVATLTLVATIRFQVSDEFDTRRATQVELRSRLEVMTPTRTGEFPPDENTVDRVEGLSGVTGVAVVREVSQDQPVAVNRLIDPTAGPSTIPIYGLNAAGFDTVEATISGPGWDTWHDRTAQRVAVVSQRTAAQIGATDIAAGDHLFIGGLQFTVAGILESAPRLGALTGGITIPVTTIDHFDVDADRDRMVVVTAPGAANQVARVLPIAVSPTAPETWIAYAPGEDDTLRLAVDDQLQALALGLGGIVLILGIVSIGNATLTSVLQRIHEIGLRRALGARPRHIATHILIDSGVVGFVGGMIGVTLGLTATLAVTTYRQWIPVIDPIIPMVTLTGAVLSGILAGVYPARIGSGLQPTEALRRE